MVPSGVPTCTLCQVNEAIWICNLDQDRARFTVYGDGHIWSSRIRVCERCEQLVRVGDLAGLTAADPRSSSLQPNDVEEQVRNGLRALTGSVVRVEPIDDVLPPGSRARRRRLHALSRRSLVRCSLRLHGPAVIGARYPRATVKALRSCLTENTGSSGHRGRRFRWRACSIW